MKEVRIRERKGLPEAKRGPKIKTVRIPTKL